MTEKNNNKEPTERDNTIRKVYTESKGNLDIACNILRIKYKIRTKSSYIAKEWGKAGYIPYEQKLNISEEDRTLITRRYTMYKGDPNLAAQSMRFPSETIRTVWKEEGLEIRVNGAEDELYV